MRAVVVYESMFGNTHEVAERIAEGLGDRLEVDVLSVGDAIAQILGDVDLFVVGGPTHGHGMSRHSSRAAAVREAAEHDDLAAEPDADGPGLREWFRALPHDDWGAAVAFDTRYDAPPVLTGRASKRIAKQLDEHGFEVIAEPESFLVDRRNQLVIGEADRALFWGRALGHRLVPSAG